MDWVQCDGGCNQWFHMLCVGLIKSQIKPDDDYVCKKCKRTTDPAADKTQTPTNNGTKKPKNGINNGRSTNDKNKKRLSRGRDEIRREKTKTPTTTSDDSTLDSTKTSESRRSPVPIEPLTTQNDKQLINTAWQSEITNEENVDSNAFAPSQLYWTFYPNKTADNKKTLKSKIVKR